MSLTFFRDKDFFRAMVAIAVPVAFQQLITAGLNMIDVLMVGQLGETAVAALGLANQIFFLANPVSVRRDERHVHFHSAILGQRGYGADLACLEFV